MQTDNLQKRLPRDDAKGIYVLTIWLPGIKTISFGKRSAVFRRGYYYYTGSAFGSGGLASRLGRHISGNKKLYWHIDYLLAEACLKDITIFRKERWYEHELASRLMKTPGVSAAVERFGSGDCDCPTHLFYSGSKRLSISEKL